MLGMPLFQEFLNFVIIDLIFANDKPILLSSGQLWRVGKIAYISLGGYDGRLLFKPSYEKNWAGAKG